MFIPYLSFLLHVHLHYLFLHENFLLLTFPLPPSTLTNDQIDNSSLHVVPRNGPVV